VPRYLVRLFDEPTIICVVLNSSSHWPKCWWAVRMSSFLVRKYFSTFVCTPIPDRNVSLSSFFKHLNFNSRFPLFSVLFTSVSVIIKVLPFQSLFSLRHSTLQTSALGNLLWYIPLLNFSA
jgi:hypothetical protein